MFEWIENFFTNRKARVKVAFMKYEKAAIAKRFNAFYSIKNDYTKERKLFPNHRWITQDNAWMCPECNKIHSPVELSILVGIVYPSCCSFAKGHRWTNADIK